MGRINRTRLFRIVVLFAILSTLLLIQNLATRYHSSVYQLTPFNELQATYESTIATVSTNENIVLIDYKKCLNLNLTNGISSSHLSTCLNRLFVHSADHVAKITNVTGTISMAESHIPRDLYLLQSWLNDTTTKDNDLLKRFNLSRLSFNPENNLNDKYVYFTLKHIQQLDMIVQLNYSAVQNPVDIEIDRRRSSGKLTNLKISEFANIVNVRYGGEWCDHNYGSNLTAVVFVITKPDDFKIRSLIRQTWGRRFGTSTNSTIRLYFAFGMMPRNQKMEHGKQKQEQEQKEKQQKQKFSSQMIDRMIDEEWTQFSDIIQWSFEDGYYRLTIKSLAILRWTSVYCPRVPVVFKIDADCMLNYDNLNRFSQLVAHNASLTNKYYIYGNLWRRAAVIRSAKSKFYTSFHDYPMKIYPDYVGGPWLLAGSSLPLFLLRMAILHSMPALLWEDLYISGIVAQKLIDINFPLQRHYMYGFEYNVDLDKLDYCLFNRSIILTQAMNESNLESIWFRLSNLQTTTTTTFPNAIHLSESTTLRDNLQTKCIRTW